MRQRRHFGFFDGTTAEHLTEVGGLLERLAEGGTKRANAVAPGMVDTALLDGKVDDAGKRRVAEGVPLGRLALSDDIANACVFLASDLSAYVTGVVLDVSGGMHIH